MLPLSGKRVELEEQGNVGTGGAHGNNYGNKQLIFRPLSVSVQ